MQPALIQFLSRLNGRMSQNAVNADAANRKLAGSGVALLTGVPSTSKAALKVPIKRPQPLTPVASLVNAYGMPELLLDCRVPIPDVLFPGVKTNQ